MANDDNKRSKSRNRQRRSRSRKSRSKQQTQEQRQPISNPAVPPVPISRQKARVFSGRVEDSGFLQKNGSLLTQTFNKLTDMWHESQKGFPSLSTNNSKAMEQTGYVTGSICIEPSPSQLVFQCQLAHGSPTGLVADFTNPAELYKKIAACFDDVSEDQILFCTRNTHRVDMDAVFINTLAVSDFLFAHLAGQRKEVVLVKTKSMLGVTVADNGAGRVFVRRIDTDSNISAANGAIQVGDHIEKINGESMIGKRHYQVAQALRSIQTNKQFTLRLVSPLKNGFSMVSPRQCGSQNGKKTVSDANATIRFNKHGKPVVEEVHNEVVTKQLNEVFAKYLGFQDERLTADILEISDSCNTLLDMEQAVQSTPLAEFRFPTEFLFDLWGIINDAKRQKTL